MDDDIPNFEGTTVRDVSNELRDHTCTPTSDHKADHVFVTTRNQARRTRRTRSRDGPVSDEEALALKERDDPWAEIEVFDAVDIESAQEPWVAASGSQVLPPQDDLLAPLTLEEIAEEQRVDYFCQTVRANNRKLAIQRSLRTNKRFCSANTPTTPKELRWWSLGRSARVYCDSAMTRRSRDIWGRTACITRSEASITGHIWPQRWL